MDVTVTFEFFKAYPPNRKGVVIEIHVTQGGAIDVPAEVFREGGQLRLTIFGREGGPSWEYPADEFVDAMRKAIDLLAGPGADA